MAFESFAYNQYAITRQVRSEIDPEVTQTVEDGFRCPRCKHANQALDHAEGVVCPKCGLAMCKYGNGLSCATEGQKELARGLRLGPMAPPLSMLRPELKSVT